MEVIVREYVDDDLESVNKILDEAFSAKKDKISGDQFIELVASIDNDVCGYLLMTKVINPIRSSFYYLIDYVCVSSSYRNMGIGEKMIDYAIKIAEKEKAAYVQLTCSYKRVAAHRLYEKCGFIKRESDIFRKELL